MVASICTICDNEPMGKVRHKRNQKFVALREPNVTVEELEQSDEPRTQEIKTRSSGLRTVVYWFLCTAFVTIPFGILPGFMNPYNKAFFAIILVAAISFVAVVVAIIQKSLSIYFSPFLAAVGIWLLVKIITTWTSILPARSFAGLYGGWSDGFVYGLGVAVILLVILALNFENNRIARLVNLILAQAVVLSIGTIAEGIQAGFFYQKVRPNSPLLNADYFLSYILLILPIFVILIIWQVRQHRIWRASIYAVGTMIVSMALFMTLPTHLQTILLPGLENGKKDSTFGATDSQQISATNFTQTNANLERWSEWKIGITLGALRPLVGTGPSTTRQAFIMDNNHLNLKGWDHSRVPDRSHNDVIEQFSQEGILGLLSYLALWAVFGWIIFTRWKYIEAPVKPYAWGLLGGLILWLGFNLFLFTTVVAGLISWIWIALLLTMVKTAREVTNARALITARVVIVFFTIVMGGLALWSIHFYEDDLATVHAMGLLSGLKQGSYQNLGGQDRVNLGLQAEDELTNSSDDMSSEDYYSNQAAIASIDNYIAVKNNDPKDASGLTEKALRYAKQAVSTDPYSATNLQTLGGIEYYLAPKGSTDEKQGIAQIDRGITMTPMTVAFYLEAAEIAALKKDYPLANSYIKTGLAATKDVKDSTRANLIKLQKAYPQS